jgi:hypothetical protein
MNEYFQQISSSYDALADEYIARIYHELEHKPLDRDWLARLAAAVGTPGPICDMGCGPGGEVLLAFHVGDEVRHIDTLWEHQVSLDFLFYPRVLLEDHLRAAGFEVVESIERDPYEDLEVATRRAYLRARK